MGIVNVTPDSFYAGSRIDGLSKLISRVSGMLEEGADIIDIGGCSTRPGAEEITCPEEMARLTGPISEIKARFPEAVLSVDTYRAGVARECFMAGADIINDISGGNLDPEMFETVAELGCPYVLTHSRGVPATMQTLTDYDDVCAEVLTDLAFKADRLHGLGVCDVIVDPGFGFAKTTEQNYRLLGALGAFRTIGPVLAGMSRKSMVTRVIGREASEALNGTTALNMIALLNGASVLRVHDVKAAREAVSIFEAYRNSQNAAPRIITTIENGITLPPEVY